jgi:hypothetical protein
MDFQTALSAVLPPVSALAGVVIAQRWAGRHERWRQRVELDRALWAARREVLARFLVALNQAVDSTRAALREGVTAEATRTIDHAREGTWNAAYERYLEVALVFPPDAVTACLDHLHSLYRWRRSSVARHDELPLAPGSGGIEDLIDQLRPWLSPSDLELRSPKRWLRVGIRGTQAPPPVRPVQ